MTPITMTQRERHLRQLAAASGLRSLSAVARAAKMQRHTIRDGLRGGRLLPASIEKLAAVLNVAPSILRLIFEATS